MSLQTLMQLLKRIFSCQLKQVFHLTLEIDRRTASISASFNSICLESSFASASPFLHSRQSWEHGYRRSVQRVPLNQDALLERHAVLDVVDLLPSLLRFPLNDLEGSFAPHPSPLAADLFARSQSWSSLLRTPLRPQFSSEMFQGSGAFLSPVWSSTIVNLESRYYLLFEPSLWLKKRSDFLSRSFQSLLLWRERVQLLLEGVVSLRSFLDLVLQFDHLCPVQ